MDLVIYILLLLIGGCFAGFLAGLLGIGGGIIITPIQYFLLINNGCNPKMALTITFATGLFVIGVTMINSSHQHYKNNSVNTKFLRPMIILSIISTVIGVLIALHMDVNILKVIFGIICILSVIPLAFIKSKENNNDKSLDNKLIHYLISIVLGLLSGLIGPAGGALLIPLFIIVLKYPMHKTIGTGSVLSIGPCIVGVITYIITGLNVPNLPAFNIGYVNILQFILLTIPSVFIAKYAAQLSKKINTQILKVMQIVVISYIGLNMIGIV